MKQDALVALQPLFKILIGTLVAMAGLEQPRRASARAKLAPNGVGGAEEVRAFRVCDIMETRHHIGR